jgi:hypothetical protein
MISLEVLIVLKEKGTGVEHSKIVKGVCLQNTNGEDKMETVERSVRRVLTKEENAFLMIDAPSGSEEDRDWGDFGEYQ